jgi:hypothetical protein
MTEKEQAVREVAEAVRQVKLSLLSDYRKEIEHAPRLTKASMIHAYMRGMDDMFQFIGQKPKVQADAPSQATE